MIVDDRGLLGSLLGLGPRPPHEAKGTPELPPPPDLILVDVTPARTNEREAAIRTTDDTAPEGRD
jgi:hypothetical protein